MGLDVAYFTNLKAVRRYTEDDRKNHTHCEQDLVKFFDNRVFEGRIGSINPDMCYSYDALETFFAGGYTDYGNWRNELAKVAGYQPVDKEHLGKTIPSHEEGACQQSEGPFWELINFSDCSGTIGPEICAKLAQDFLKFDEAAKSHRCSDELFYYRYRKWKAAFETAANTGAVSFQ